MVHNGILMETIGISVMASMGFYCFLAGMSSCLVYYSYYVFCHF